MPELPEVETVRRSIEKKIIHKRIRSVDVRNDDVLDGITAEAFCSLFRDHAVIRMDRRGKYLIFCLESGEKVLLHLRMTGQLIAFDDDFQEDRHCHVIMRFDEGGLYYRDVRRFGRFCLMGSGGKTEKGLDQLGYEPFDRKFTVNYVRNGVAGRHCSVKSRILDQHFIAGIGNIYADEILFSARIHPERMCCDLTEAQIRRLKKASETVLAEAIEHRGTTFSDFRDGYGEIGGHQEHLSVFHRAGEPCLLCGTTIEKIKCGGRTTSFCPKCQKR